MKRQGYLSTLRKLINSNGSPNIVYFDESGFKTHTGRLSGWAAKGQKLYGDVKGKRDSKTNLLMAQCRKQWLAPLIFNGSCTAALVTRWVRDMLLKELKKPSIVIMDNAPVHNKKQLGILLKQHGHVLLPLPPYSPDLNPIEKSFAAIKKRREAMPINTTIQQLIMSYS